MINTAMQHGRGDDRPLRLLVQGAGVMHDGGDQDRNDEKPERDSALGDKDRAGESGDHHHQRNEHLRIRMRRRRVEGSEQRPPAQAGKKSATSEHPFPTINGLAGPVGLAEHVPYPGAYRQHREHVDRPHLEDIQRYGVEQHQKAQKMPISAAVTTDGRRSNSIPMRRTSASALSFSEKKDFIAGL